LYLHFFINENKLLKKTKTKYVFNLITISHSMAKYRTQKEKGKTKRNKKTPCAT